MQEWKILITEIADYIDNKLTVKQTNVESQASVIHSIKSLWHSQRVQSKVVTLWPIVDECGPINILHFIYKCRGRKKMISDKKKIMLNFMTNRGKH